MELSDAGSTLFGASYIDGFVVIFDVDADTGDLSNMREVSNDGTPALTKNVNKRCISTRSSATLAEKLLQQMILRLTKSLCLTREIQVTWNSLSRVSSKQGCELQHGVFYPANAPIATH